MESLNRTELLEKIEEIKFWPELVPFLKYYLEHYIEVLDEYMVQKLLENGADPNPDNELHCHLGCLLHEYRVVYTTGSKSILKIMELLLMYGADPNRIWMNNLRAYDYAVRNNENEITDLLEKYGAYKYSREKI